MFAKHYKNCQNYQCKSEGVRHYALGLCSTCYQTLSKGRIAYFKRQHTKMIDAWRQKRKQEVLGDELSYPSLKRSWMLKETDITSDFLRELWDKTSYCIFCGCFLTEARELDHIIPLSIPNSVGHVQTNVRYICKPCNVMKSKMLDEEIPLEKIVERLNDTVSKL